MDRSLTTGLLGQCIQMISNCGFNKLMSIPHVGMWTVILKQQSADHQLQYQQLFQRYESCSQDKMDATNRIQLLEKMLMTVLIDDYEEKITSLTWVSTRFRLSKINLFSNQWHRWGTETKGSWLNQHENLGPVSKRTEERRQIIKWIF